MAKKQYCRKTKKPNPVVPLGIGLLLIGSALVWLPLPKTGGVDSGSEAITFAPLEVNYPAPELTLTNIDGKTQSLADYRSSVVLVNNWATWCPPCKAEMPVLEAYYEDHADEGFMIIAVESGDAQETVAQFAESYGLQFQVWLDPKGAAIRAFGNGSLPNSYVIDRSGAVRYLWTGEVNRAVLEKYVTPLFAE